MSRERKDVGDLGESVACQYLESKGFRVIERNFLRSTGEIDIVAEKGSTVRFVEVKTLSRENLDSISREMDSYRPEEQVHASKLRKVARTAELYMQEKNDPRDFQIDVVGVYLDVRRRMAKCRLFEQVL